jgi:hypothetical protein
MHARLLLALALTASVPAAASLSLLQWQADPQPFFFAHAERHPAGFLTSEVVVADIDQDGRQDLIIGKRSTQHLDILLHDATSTFQVFAGPSPRGIAVADFDGDGDLDLATANYQGASIALIRNRGDLNFEAPVAYATARWPRHVVAADFDADGDVDLVSTNEDTGVTPAGSVWFHRNDGTAVFAPSVKLFTEVFPSPLAGADFDDDGDVDVVVGGLFETFVLMNAGDGSFTRHAYPGGAQNVAARDVDRDGDLDLLTVGFRGVSGIRLMRNSGTGEFTSEDISPVFTSSLAIADIDEDGIDDFVATIPFAFEVQSFRGIGDGTFVPAGTAHTPGFQNVHVATLDRDDDGHVDLAIADLGQTVNEGSFSILLTVPGVTAVSLGQGLTSWHVQLNHDDVQSSLATDLAAYSVISAGEDIDDDGNPFGDGDDRAVTPTAVAYDAAANRINVEMPSTLFGHYIRVEIDGDDAGADGVVGLADPDGHFLAGGDSVVLFDLRVVSFVADLAARAEAVPTLRAGSLRGALKLAESPDNVTALIHQLEAFAAAVERSFNDGDVTVADRDAFLADVKLIIDGLRSM